MPLLHLRAERDKVTGDDEVLNLNRQIGFAGFGVALGYVLWIDLSVFLCS